MYSICCNRHLYVGGFSCSLDNVCERGHNLPVLVPDCDDAPPAAGSGCVTRAGGPVPGAPGAPCPGLRVLGWGFRVTKDENSDIMLLEA